MGSSRGSTAQRSRRHNSGPSGGSASPPATTTRWRPSLPEVLALRVSFLIILLPAGFTASALTTAPMLSTGRRQAAGSLTGCDKLPGGADDRVGREAELSRQRLERC